MKLSGNLEACRDSFIPSYIGWMFLSESCTNSASWYLTACTIKRLSTLWNCANQSQVSHHGNISDPPPDSSQSYRATSSTPMADRFLCGWSVGLEFLAGQLAESDYWRKRFQTISGDVSVRNVLMHSVH